MKSPLPLLMLACLCPLAPVSVRAGEEHSRHNILFIAVDDLRPELGAYGAAHIQSPHIDQLASESLLFEQAYCMVATCGASRSSMLTGVRPTKDRFVTHNAYAHKDAPWAVPLNTHFKNAGYHAISLGKVYHHKDDHEDGWSEKPWKSDRPKFHDSAKASGPRGDPIESANVDDAFYGDGDLALQAIKKLEERSADPETPFLLAVGFAKPHLPFVAPQKYWELYPPESIQLPQNYSSPANAPQESLHKFGELRNYNGIPKQGPVSDAQALELIRGYYACVSYVDAQIGKILQALQQLQLDDNTIVVLWGDHGWNLGDHSLWCKHSVYESSLHIPLLLKAPGFTPGRTSGLTESIDIYPTLCELAGVPIPHSVEGKSFVPLLRDPSRPWAEVAASRFGRGDSIRTSQYRYSEYIDSKGEFTARMLYDHEADPLENKNIAEQKSLQDTVSRLSSKLHQAMQATHD
ncbi:sulfatase [Pelagicoccus sp. NFK12]|uniref:Sulfatase n=1 Tax=Pelagicoccus enzymogenes TaxID=2773457 RepID=A0A927F875_9BACT|nr:sulfatase [Pelagicoccus enzymogenes]MBD5779516.1 sulfatase [Pelagicoccus enzymogenes]